ncbi:MAG TPA: hypothetical protein VD994_09210 [Prosthecobacter sp.]|nr:hypothetical protein [Prosthecobacter sp.]
MTNPIPLDPHGPRLEKLEGHMDALTGKTDAEKAQSNDVMAKLRALEGLVHKISIPVGWYGFLLTLLMFNLEKIGIKTELVGRFAEAVVKIMEKFAG